MATFVSLLDKASKIDQKSCLRTPLEAHIWVWLTNQAPPSRGTPVMQLVKSGIWCLFDSPGCSYEAAVDASTKAVLALHARTKLPCVSSLKLPCLIPLDARIKLSFVPPPKLCLLNLSVRSYQAAVTLAVVAGDKLTRAHSLLRDKANNVVDCLFYRR